MFRDKTVVVTGGSGFIGINLIQSLMLDQAVVLAVSRTRPNIAAGPPGQFRWIQADLQQTTLQKAVGVAGIDYIFHLAAMSGGIHYLKQHQAECLQTNLAITANSFYKSERFKNLKGQLFLSSVCAYPQEYQTTDDLNVIRLAESLSVENDPDSSYGWSKIMGEMLIKHYADELSVPGVAIRLFNTYGPYEHLDSNVTHVIPSLIVKAVEYPQKPFTVLGDGSQVRSFLYVDDAIRALKLGITRVHNGAIINVGDPTPVTIRELVARVVAISGKNIAVEYLPEAGVGARGRIPNVSIGKREFGDLPSTKLDDGLKQTFHWIESQLNQKRLSSAASTKMTATKTSGARVFTNQGRET